MAFIYGNNSSETINAADGVTNGNDDIYGYGGADDIFGLDGNDNITGGAGADDIDGGEGSDYAKYGDSNKGVTVNLMTGLGYGGTAEGDTLTSIENLVGSLYNDVLIGNDGDNTLMGLSGDDSLIGGYGVDKLYGGNDNDSLKGGGGADILNGGNGIDTASYDGSNAGVSVSLFHDFSFGGHAEGDELTSIENLIGSKYDDNLWGDDGVNILWGQNGNDTLKGYGGADTIYGGSGKDFMDGGAGIDTMIGGTGDDTYYVDDGADIVTELAGQGNDTVYSTAFAYTLAANAEILSLDTATDTGVYGTGNALNNTIFGNAGDNVLDGGGNGMTGGDSLSGLGGNDTFVFHPGQAHGDVVYEFNGNGAGAGDVLQFVGYGTIAQGATFHQLTATEWEIGSADGLTHEIITLIGGPPVDASDFVFV